MILKNVCIEVKYEQMKIALDFLHNKGYRWMNLADKTDTQLEFMLRHNLYIYYINIRNDMILSWQFRPASIFDNIKFDTLLREAKLKRILK